MNDRLVQQYGRCYEDFEVGTVYEHRPGRTITPYDNMSFSLMTQNQHPAHIDHFYGSQTRFGEPLVVGLLVLSISVGQSVADISGKAVANLGYDDVRHLAPTFHGDTIYSETEVLDKRLSRKTPTTGVVHVRTLARNQRSSPVLSFERHLLVPVLEGEED
ncbi:MAG: MaoC family dehydratase [Propionibacteriales bacterium]|nr:MaoC family dehydratase [Propionibacteriales bacterium]